MDYFWSIEYLRYFESFFFAEHALLQKGRRKLNPGTFSRHQTILNCRYLFTLWSLAWPSFLEVVLPRLWLGCPLMKYGCAPVLYCFHNFNQSSLLSAVLMSVWSVVNNSVTAEICLRVSPTTPGDCEKVVVIVALLLLLLLLLLLVCSCCCCYRCGREQCQFCAK